MTLAGRTLLTLTLEIEERVVNADGETDEEDDLGDGLVHRDDLARERGEADRGDHRREGEQERHERRDERTEDEDEDHERQREREHSRRLQLAPEHLVERLARADAAGLADVEVGMLLLNALG